VRAPGGPVHVTPTARELAEIILHPPLAPVAYQVAPPRIANLLADCLSVVPRWTYDWTLWPAIALLPPDLRDEFGIHWSGERRIVADRLLRSWQAWRPLLPPAFRQFGIASAADRRVATTDPVSRVAGSAGGRSGED